MSDNPGALTGDQVRRLRLRAQRLDRRRDGPGANVSQVLKAVCGVQAQESPAAALAVRVRSSDLSAEDVEQARIQDRSVIRTWCQRGTLHLLAVEDYAWLLPLLGPIFISGSRRRHQELGLDEGISAKGIQLLRRALADQGPLTRESIARLLGDAGLPSQGQAPFHLIHRAALQGVLCQGPDLDGKPAYVRVEDWLGKEFALEDRLDEAGSQPREASFDRLARRYLEAYGPAGPQDLASWSGIPLGQARAAWERLEGDMVSVEIPGGRAWMLKERLAWLDQMPAQPVATPAQPVATPAQPVVHLLPKFDAYLLGYTTRELAVAARHARRIHPGGGILNPALLVDGCALGVWSLKRRRDRLEVKVEPFESLPEEVQPALEAEAEDLGRFLGLKSDLSLISPQA